MHKAVETDRSGHIEAAELSTLGQARRKVGQRKGEWTKGMNQRMVDRMDSSGDGKIGADEFAQHFDQVLSSDAAEFDATIT